MESYLDAVYSSARAHFKQGGRRLLVATSFPMGGCPVSALRGMRGSEGEGLLACRLVWAEQSFAARRLMYCNASKSACCFTIDNGHVCSTHGRKCSRRQASALLAKVRFGAGFDDLVGNLEDLLSHPGLCVAGVISDSKWDEPRALAVAEKCKFSAAFCVMAPRDLGLPLTCGHDVFCAFFVRLDQKHDAASAVEILRSWTVPSVLSLKGTLLPKSHSLLRGAEMLGQAAGEHLSAGDDGVVERLAEAAKRRKFLPADCDLAAPVPNVQPSLPWSSANAARIAVGARVLQHQASGNDDYVVLDARSCKEVVMGSIPALRDSSIIMVGWQRKQTAKVRVMLSPEVLAAKGFQHDAMNLSLMGGPAAQVLVKGTMPMPVAFGMLHALAFVSIGEGVRCAA